MKIRIPRSVERVFWISLVVSSWALSGLSAGTDSEISHKYQHLLQAIHFYTGELFVEEVDERSLWEGAVRGMLASTGDPYTRFLNREELKEFSSTESGRRVGIGAEITIRGGYPVVIAPVEGGPAMKAGIMPGDKIIKIDDVPTEGVSFGDLLKQISGDSGTVVKLEVNRQSSPGSIQIPVTRGVFKLDYVTWEYLPGKKTGYLRLSHFFGEDSGSVDEFRKALETFQKKGAKSVILDLRNNSGGHLDMAVTLAGYFLKKDDTVVYAKGRKPEDNREYKVSRRTEVISDDVKLFVLINKGSASASEILAGALQDHRRATLVGTQSFGKASVQRVVRPLPDDTAALITIQKYYTPLMRHIHNKGLKPDIVLEEFKPTIEDLYFLEKMKKVSFISNFEKRNPSYSAGLFKKFKSEATKKGWPVSEELTRRIIAQAYGRFKKGAPDPAIDSIFQRALEEAGK